MTDGAIMLALDDEGVDLSEALAEAQAAVLEAERRKVASARDTVRAPAIPGGWLAAAIAVWTLLLGLITFRPAIARGAEPHPFVTAPGAEEASLRFSLWLARQRVDQFVASRGRLPSFLGETGFTDSGVTLRVTGDRRYELHGSLSGLQLVLGSRMAADSFLGQSLVQLGGSPPAPATSRPERRRSSRPGGG
jgi:hypothetical protein